MMETNRVLREYMEKAAAERKGLYEALKRIEAEEMAFRDARALMNAVYPKSTRDDTVIRLMVLRHKGYIEWPGNVSYSTKAPLGLRITENGHEYFKRMIEETKDLA